MEKYDEQFVSMTLDCTAILDQANFYMPPPPNDITTVCHASHYLLSALSIVSSHEGDNKMLLLLHRFQCHPARLWVRFACSRGGALIHRS